MGLFRILMRAMSARPPPRRGTSWQAPGRPIPREMRFPATRPDPPKQPDSIISGRCHVIDGDTIVINRIHIRLAGIDAPELDHPWGQKSKWALVALCRGQAVTARIKPEMSYDRVVAQCFLPDGRDLAAELVKAGLALDWPKFSGGKYRSLEPPDARKKLWRANIRQSGVMWPADSDDVPVPATNVGPAYRWRRADAPEVKHPQPRRLGLRIGWLAFSVALLLVGCNVIGRDTERTGRTAPRTPAPALASLSVTAHVLNVRREPGASSSVIAQIGMGTTVVPKRVSGPWYGIEMADGSTGWVHGDFLGPAGE